MQLTTKTAFILGGVSAALLTYVVMNGQLNTAYNKVFTLEHTVATQNNTLLGHTQYTTYLTVGKQSLSDHLKLMTATVVRDENVMQMIEKSLLGFDSSGTVAVYYTVEYAFGYDLAASQYDIKQANGEIEIHIKKPQLVTMPAVSNLHYKILDGGLLIDEKEATLKLYEAAAQNTKAQGIAMAATPAIMALCEKKLTDFLYDFLKKQPGVTTVPYIRVVYH